MNLFDIIPSNFFNLLAGGGNQRIYSDCMSIIYEQYEREISYRIPRAVLRDALAVYLLENHISLEEDGEEEYTGHGDMASGLLRRFCDCGWLEEETDDNTYERHIMMTERGIMLAEFLEALKKPETEEYSGYIYQIFNTIKNKDLWKEHPYVNGLKSIFKNSKDLANSLKKLSTFIRKIIEKMVIEETLETLTENLIGYLDGSFIREYARLTGQQNIHIYRGQIKKELERIKHDDGLNERMIAECMTEEALSHEDAALMVTDMLQAAKQFILEDYDRIMRDIKHKITVYMQVAVGRARFLRNRDSDDKGLVENVIKLLAQNEEELRSVVTPEEAALFTLERYEYISRESIRYPRKLKAIRLATDTQVYEMSEEDLEETIRRQKKEADNPYSMKNMKLYLDALCKEKGYVKTEDMPLTTREDLLCALSSVAYSKENGYITEPEEGYVETDSLMLRRFKIRRK